MKPWNNCIIIFVLSSFLLIPSVFYSQGDTEVFYSQTPESGTLKKNKEFTPLFILQGAVKIKGKPASSVALTLTKDGKTISKIITPKNGLYYFQMSRSMTDPNSEYRLYILKDGVASGVLRINTYTPKEKFTYIPYMFNLDITFALRDSARTIEKRDFGKIRWMTERNVFDFDKSFSPEVEKKMQEADSIKLVEKVKEEQELKRQADSIAESWAVAAKEEIAKRKAAKAAAERVAKEAAEKKSKSSDIKNTGKQKNDKEIVKSDNTNTASKGSKLSSTSNNAVTSTKLEKAIAGKSDKTSTSSNTDVVKSGNTTKIGNAISDGKTTINSEKEKSKSQQIPATADIAKNKNGIAEQNIAERDSLVSSDAEQKDLFFLTGVPMEKFKKDLPVGETYSRNTDGYEGTEAFILNNERNRLIAARQRYERIKAENFAKKQETNNTLTSLMDVVEEYDKRRK